LQGLSVNICTSREQTKGNRLKVAEFNSRYVSELRSKVALLTSS